MKWLYAVILFAAGATGGWLSHAYVYKHQPGRNAAPRTAARTTPPERDRTRADGKETRTHGDSDQSREPPSSKPGPDAEGGTDGDAAEPEGLTKEPTEEQHKAVIAKFKKTFKPQWKAMAQMGARGRLMPMLLKLGFDESTAKEIQKALMEDLDRQMDKLIEVFFGEGEIDPDAFTAFFGVPSTLSPELETTVGGFLDDAEIAKLRSGVKKAHGEQVRFMADVQIGQMGLPGLTDDQRTRLGEVMTGRDAMTQMMKGMTEVFRDPAVRNDPKAIESKIRAGFNATRHQITGILTPEQVKRYDAFIDQQVVMAGMQMKAMAAMFKPDKKPTESAR